MAAESAAGTTPYPGLVDVFLMILVAVGIVVAVVMGLTHLVTRRAIGRYAQQARALMPPAGPEDMEANAVGMTKPHRAFGLLRLTDEDVLFGNAQAGNVLTIPRTSIVTAFASDDIPTGGGMQTLRKPALVLQISDPTIGEGLAFVVPDPQPWVDRIRG